MTPPPPLGLALISIEDGPTDLDAIRQAVRAAAR
jgi:hypothetical protein